MGPAAATAGYLLTLGSLDLAADLLTINKGTVKLGQTPLCATGTVNMKTSPAQLDLNLKATNVSVLMGFTVKAAAKIRSRVLP